jgi:diadenylate cyclase
MIGALYEWLSTVLATLAGNYHPIWDTLDIALVAMSVYWLLLLIKGTRAEQMILGLLIVVLAWLVSQQAQLATLGFILDNFLSWGVLIVIVIFQGDIRRGLTRVGGGVFAAPSRHKVQSIEEMVRAAQALSQRRVGALIVVQREIELEEFTELGTRLDAELSRDLLIALFLPYSPLHDGAVMVRENRVSAAGCILPLAMRSNLPSSLGTRHRAALGISEETDAIAIVVSEETGRISLFCAGEIRSELDGPNLRQVLLTLTGLVREVEAEASVAAPAREEEPVAPPALPARSEPT